MLRLGVMFGVVVCVAAIPSFSVGADQKPDGASAVAKIPEIQQAMGLLRSGDYEGAVSQLKAAAKQHPELPSAHAIVARWLSAMNQPAQMRSALEDGVAENPADPEVYLMLSELAMRNHQYTEAGLLYAKILELLATDKREVPAVNKTAARRAAHAGLAMIAESRRDWTGARQHIEAVLADEPSNTIALQQLGRVLFHEKKYDEAFTRLQQAVAADKNLLNAEATMANLYLQAGDYPAANEWMLKAIKAFPQDYKTRLVAAEYSLKIGNLKQAATQADAAITLAPEAFEGRMIRGVVAGFAKEYAVAQKSLEQAHLLAPSNSATTNSLIFALAEQNDEAKRKLALEYAQINSRAFPDQPETMATLGWAYYRLGRLDDAEAALRKSASMGKITGDAAYFLARVLVDRGRKEEAQRVFTQMLEPIIKSGALFAMRPEAEALGTELNK